MLQRAVLQHHQQLRRYAKPNASPNLAKNIDANASILIDIEFVCLFRESTRANSNLNCTGQWNGTNQVTKA